MTNVLPFPRGPELTGARVSGCDPAPELVLERWPLNKTADWLCEHLSTWLSDEDGNELPVVGELERLASQSLDLQTTLQVV